MEWKKGEERNQSSFVVCKTWMKGTANITERFYAERAEEDICMFFARLVSSDKNTSPNGVSKNVRPDQAVLLHSQNSFAMAYLVLAPCSLL
eukprot:6263756-Amphidinium_carterae.1